MPPRPVRRAGLVLTGAVMGLFILGITLWLFVRVAQVGEVEREIGRRLDLPEETLEVEAITDEGLLRVALREVVLLSDAGDTVAVVPRLRMWFDPASAGGDGPLEFTEVVLEDPYLRLVQTPRGEWNLFQALRLEAGGREVAGEGAGRAVVFRDVEVVDGRVLVAIPTEPVDTTRFAARLELPIETVGGRPYQVYRFRDVDARLPRVAFGGERAWEAAVTALDARLVEPDLRITDLEATLAAAGEEAFQFDLDLLRVGESRFAGAGEVRFGGDQIVYDVRIEADPVRFADLQPLLPGLPDEGRARFTLVTEPVGGGRTELAFQELAVQALDASVAGRLTVVVGGEQPPVFRDTELAVESLEIATLERLGLLDDVPVQGVISGTLAAPEVTADRAGGLQVDLTARLRPEGEPGAEPSVIGAVGGVTLGGEGGGLAFRDLRLQLQPLHLELLAPFAPEQRDRLRGTVRGAVVVEGTPRDLRLTDGTLAYSVGDAPATQLAAVQGRITLDPELRYELTARADPLALATLTELFPGLPFRSATLAGPIRVTGGGGRVTFGADLRGAAGALALEGELIPGTPARFDVTGRVETLTASSLLRGELPVEGAVTGTFAAEGTFEDFAFQVDLAQTAGRFALEGRFRRGAADGAAEFEFAGDVQDFRLGALFGRPGLFPSPLTGALRVTGGGAEPYRFDVDLRGDDGVFDLEGFYAPGEVPAYAAEGVVTGLNLAQLPLPLPLPLPRTNLNARIDLEGRGLSPETLQGSLALHAEGSTLGGVPVDRAVVRAAARDGVLRVDTFALVLRDARLSAEGALGLTQPAPTPLNYEVVAPNVRTLAAVFSGRGIPPEVSGSLRAEGWIAGTLRYPTIAVGLLGRGLRYNQWRAAQLALEAEVRRDPTVGWAGEANLAGDQVVLATGESFETLRLELNGNQQRLGVGLLARRDAASDLALSGLLEFTDGLARGAVVESLALRLDGMAWSLAERARLRWGGVEGVVIENLLVRRADGEGLIRVDGALPPTGTADLEVAVRALDLRAITLLFPRMPEVHGELALEAFLEGPVSDPELRLEAVVDSFSYEGARADSLYVSARYADRRMLTNARVVSLGEPLLAAEAAVPMTLAFEDLVPSFSLLSDQPLEARATIDSLDLALLTAAVPQLTEGAGVLRAEVVAAGTPDRPLLDGWLTVDDGAMRVIPLGLRYSDIAARVFLEGNLVRIDSLRVRSQGLATVSGMVQFTEGAGPATSLVANLQSFEVMEVEDVARVQLSGQLALAGRFPDPVLTGDVTIEESTFHIPELDQPTGLEITDVEVGQIGADTVTARGFGPGLLAGVRVEGLEVEVGESVWLESEDARIQIAGDLVGFRTGEDLRVFGLLRAERGSYTLEVGPLVRDFEIVSGTVQFFGTGDLNPELDIVAANRIRTIQSGGTTPITVVVYITGTVQFPRIRLSSDTRPPLPESEILSLLLFGRPTFELGGATRTFAEQVLAQEALGNILFTPLEEFFVGTGLVDFVRFRSVGLGLRPGEIGEALGLTTVEIGTELSDEIFLTLECGIGILLEAGTPSCGTRLQFDLGRNFTASAAYEPIRRTRLLQILSADVLQYQWSLELRRRWEYGITDAPSILEGAQPVLPDLPPARERVPPAREIP